jgi:hypothetical protein
MVFTISADEKDTFSRGIFSSEFFLAKSTLNFPFVDAVCQVLFSFIAVCCCTCPDAFLVIDFSSSEKNESEELFSLIKSRTVCTAFMNDSSTAFNVLFAALNNSFLAIKNLFQTSCT